MKYLALVFFILLNSISYSLNYKSDGSILSSSGKVIKKSNADIFIEKYSNFRENLEINDWPLAGNKHHKGYFGEKIFIERFPLPKTPNGNFNIIDLSKYNGLTKNEFIVMVIAFANDEWLLKNKIEKATALEIRKNIQAKIKIEIDIINSVENQINQIEKNISNEVSESSSGERSYACSEPSSGVGGGESSGLTPSC